MFQGFIRNVTVPQAQSEARVNGCQQVLSVQDELFTVNNIALRKLHA
jgi:hypothetical protein